MSNFIPVFTRFRETMQIILKHILQVGIFHLLFRVGKKTQVKKHEFVLCSKNAVSLSFRKVFNINDSLT